MKQTASAILTYHSLDDSGSVISTHPDLFREQIECFLKLKIPVVPLRDAQRAPGSVALTFDDGYDNFLEFGYPVIAKYGLPATLFVISGYCGRRAGWLWSQSSAMHPPRIMGLSELRTLAGSGIEIGSHTVHHPDLAALPEEHAEREIRESRFRLEDGLGRAVEAFAYPYGTCTPAVQRLVKHYFRLACGTSLGYLTGKCDRCNLPRLDVYYLRQRIWYSRLMKLDGRAYMALRRLLREARGKAQHGSPCPPGMEPPDDDAEETRP
jgi:peptidoglycan/xylan/chitin deacetylase (PgdA/CDA1 family)